MENNYRPRPNFTPRASNVEGTWQNENNGNSYRLPMQMAEDEGATRSNSCAIQRNIYHSPDNSCQNQARNNAPAYMIAQNNQQYLIQPPPFSDTRTPAGVPSDKPFNTPYNKENMDLGFNQQWHSPPGFPDLNTSRRISGHFNYNTQNARFPANNMIDPRAQNSFSPRHNYTRPQYPSTPPNQVYSPYQPQGSFQNAQHYSQSPNSYSNPCSNPPQVPPNLEQNRNPPQVPPNMEQNRNPPQVPLNMEQNRVGGSHSSVCEEPNLLTKEPNTPHTSSIIPTPPASTFQLRRTSQIEGQSYSPSSSNQFQGNFQPQRFNFPNNPSTPAENWNQFADRKTEIVNGSPSNSNYGYYKGQHAYPSHNSAGVVGEEKQTFQAGGNLTQGNSMQSNSPLHLRPAYGLPNQFTPYRNQFQEKPNFDSNITSPSSANGKNISLQNVKSNFTNRFETTQPYQGFPSSNYMHAAVPENSKYFNQVTSSSYNPRVESENQSSNQGAISYNKPVVKQENQYPIQGTTSFNSPVCKQENQYSNQGSSNMSVVQHKNQYSIPSTTSSHLPLCQQSNPYLGKMATSSNIPLDQRGNQYSSSGSTSSSNALVQHNQYTGPVTTSSSMSLVQCGNQYSCPATTSSSTPLLQHESKYSSPATTSSDSAEYAKLHCEKLNFVSPTSIAYAHQQTRQTSPYFSGEQNGGSSQSTSSLQGNSSQNEWIRTQTNKRSGTQCFKAYRATHASTVGGSCLKNAQSDRQFESSVSDRQAVSSVSDRQTVSSISDRKTVSDRQTVLDRQAVSDRQTASTVADRQTVSSVADRQAISDRQTVSSVSDRRTVSPVPDSQTISSASDRQNISENSIEVLDAYDGSCSGDSTNEKNGLQQSNFGITKEVCGQFNDSCQSTSKSLSTNSNLDPSPSPIKKINLQQYRARKTNGHEPDIENIKEPCFDTDHTRVQNTEQRSQDDDTALSSPSGHIKTTTTTIKLMHESRENDESASPEKSKLASNGIKNIKGTRKFIHKKETVLVKPVTPAPTCGDKPRKTTIVPKPAPASLQTSKPEVLCKNCGVMTSSETNFCQSCKHSIVKKDTPKPTPPNPTPPNITPPNNTQPTPPIQKNGESKLLVINDKTSDSDVEIGETITPSTHSKVDLLEAVKKKVEELDVSESKKSGVGKVEDKVNCSIKKEKFYNTTNRDKRLTRRAAAESEQTQLDEPVILTISSSEDEDDVITKNGSEGLKSGGDEFSAAHRNLMLFGGGSGDKTEGAGVSIGEDFVDLKCPAVWIGSYKAVPTEKVKFSHGSFTMVVPTLVKGESPVPLFLKEKGFLKIVAHLENELPVIIIHVRPSMATYVRRFLRMTDQKGLYLDPMSEAESRKRITIFTEPMKPEVRDLIHKFYSREKNIKNGRFNYLEYVTLDRANEIICASTPSLELQNESKSYSKQESQTLVIYPSPPTKGGITLTTDDYFCLEKEQFLNDVIIDFYLKWLLLSEVSERDRERTHVFSTFFYKRLTSMPKKDRRPLGKNNDPKPSPAERRHARVESWTKNIDIFAKDFIFIPINEHSHWFLAVICFPGLDGPVRLSDGQAIRDSKEKSKPKSPKKKTKIEIPLLDDGGEWSDRDEAEGDDDELEEEEEEEPSAKRQKTEDKDDGMAAETEASNGAEKEDTKTETDGIDGVNDAIKQPCILVFDSLPGRFRSRIVATLRDYLTVEHLKRKGVKKVFSRDTMMGACPKVPQQMNFSDCGIYTLQFAESFFARPIKDYKFPMRNLVEWFSDDIISGKRESIAALIRHLMDLYKPNHGITLPPIHFNSLKGKSSFNNSDFSSRDERRERRTKVREGKDGSLSVLLGEPPADPVMPPEPKKIKITVCDNGAKRVFMAPRSETPTPRAESPTPRSESPTPKSGTQIPRPKSPILKHKTPTPRSETPTPRSETLTPRSETPTSRSETPTPRSETPTPRPKTPTPASCSPESTFVISDDDSSHLSDIENLPVSSPKEGSLVGGVKSSKSHKNYTINYDEKSVNR